MRDRKFIPGLVVAVFIVFNIGFCSNYPDTTTSSTSASQSCSAPTTYCSNTNSCVDLNTDNNNCGTCGNACTGVQTCTNGTCI